MYAFAASETYLLNVYTTSPVLPEVQTSSAVPGQSLRPLSVAELGEPPSLWPNSITTMSLGWSRGVISEKRFSFV
jgi:hypothetical protein